MNVCDNELVEGMDDNLFTSIRHNPHHILYKLLPHKINRKYYLHHVCTLFHLQLRLIVKITQIE